MGGVVDDIVNPIGAITGIDPVKAATGFTGTSFGPTAAQQKASAAAQQGSSTPAASSGGGGGQKSNGDAMQALVGQNFAKQQAALQQQPQQQQTPMGSSFGNQLAALSQQVTAPAAPVTLPAVASPSATQLAANVTAQTANKKLQSSQQPPADPWGFPSIYAPR